MRKLLSLALILSCINSYANSITIIFVSPQSGHLTDSSLYVEVSIASTFQITTVTGNVNGSSGTLTFDIGTGNYSGYISLAGMQQGILLPLSVTATDVFATQQSASTNVLYVKPPRINMVLPIPLSNAYPDIRVKGNCISIDTCTLTIKVEFGFETVFIRNFTDLVDTTLEVQPATPGYGQVIFRAKDKWGQETTASINIIFENNPFLAEIYRAPSTILDFNYNKVLYAPTDNSGNSYGAGTLFDITSATSIPLTGSNLDNENYSFVSPHGAVYAHGTDAYDWNNSVLYPLSAVFYFDPVIHTNGEYATFTRVNGINSTGYYLRNLITKTDAFIGSIGEYVVDNDVASNGAVAYWDQMNIKFYKNNITTTIATDNNGTLRNQGPLTDGSYVVYQQGDEMGISWSIYLYNGITNSLLSSLGNYAPTPGSNYQVVNKFVAYSKPGTSGQLQVWLKDPAGVESQVSFFSTSSTIESINETGDVIFQNDGERYYVEHGSIQSKHLGKAFGKIRYLSPSWYVIEGRELYKLLVHGVVTVANGNWNDPTIWENGMVPPANADVIILNNVTVTANASCNSLTVQPSGNITVLPGVNLTILH